MLISSILKTGVIKQRIVKIAGNKLVMRTHSVSRDVTAYHALWIRGTDKENWFS